MTHELQSERFLRRADLDPDPIRQFERWLQDAIDARLPEPTAMTLATCGAGGEPSARIVLLKSVTPEGFTFFTNYLSPKARELEANPRAALVFHWTTLERQVRVNGAVVRTPREESELYFKTRPLGSRWGAWASEQSQALPDRETLERRVRETAERFGEEVPLPEHWGGYRLRPERIEFWQGRLNRLHDRFRYTLENGAWKIARLSP